MANKVEIRLNGGKSILEMCLKRLGGATHDRVLRRHLGSGGRPPGFGTVPSTPGMLPNEREPLSRAGTADLFVVVVDAQVWDHPGPFEDYAQDVTRQIWQVCLLALAEHALRVESLCSCAMVLCCRSF